MNPLLILIIPIASVLPIWLGVTKYFQCKDRRFTEARRRQINYM